jgi:hypothetical protein
VAGKTLQASVDAVPQSRPLFRQRVDPFDTKDTRPER